MKSFIIGVLLCPALLLAEPTAISYEYYSPVQPLKALMIANIYRETVNGKIIRTNGFLVDRIKEIVNEIDPNIDFIELIQESTAGDDLVLKMSLAKNDEKCSGDLCFKEMSRELTFLRDPFIPIATFENGNIGTQINVLSKYNCFGGSCASYTRYKLKSVLGPGIVFSESGSGNEATGGNILALPGRTLLSIDDSSTSTKGSAFIHDSKFKDHKKIILEGHPLMGIGHVDEVIQVIPDPTSRCGAALIVASPKLFLEKFGSFKLSYFKDTEDFGYKNPHYQKLMDLANHVHVSKYREYYKNLFKMKDNELNPENIQSYLYKHDDEITLSVLLSPYVDELEEDIQSNVDKIRNNYVCPEQDHISKVVVAGKTKLVKDSVRAASPDAALSVYKMPVMWTNGFSFYEGGTYVTSVLPNFINSIIIPKYSFYSGTSKLSSLNVHILIPDAYVFNDAYRFYTRKLISDQYASIQRFIVKKNTAAKLNVDYKITLHFVDASFYGDSRGDLHCATNEIRSFFYE